MKYLKLFLIILSVTTVVTGCGGKDKEIKEENKQEQTEERKSIIADSFEFTTNSVNFENENSVFDINVKNTANEERYINEFLIHVKDAEGNDMAGLYGYINETIEANGERTISCSFGGNLSGYASLEFEVLK